MGVYGSSTFFQGQPATPAAHPAPSSSSCTTLSTISNGFFIAGTSIGLSAPTSASATSSSVSKNTIFNFYDFPNFCVASVKFDHSFNLKFNLKLICVSFYFYGPMGSHNLYRRLSRRMLNAWCTFRSLI